MFTFLPQNYISNSFPYCDKCNRLVTINRIKRVYERRYIQTVSGKIKPFNVDTKLIIDYHCNFCTDSYSPVTSKIEIWDGLYQEIEKIYYNQGIILEEIKQSYNLKDNALIKFLEN